MKKILLLITAFFMLSLLAGCGEAEESYERGLSLFLEGSYEEARDCFLLSVSQGKKDAVLSADLALCCSKLSDTEAADRWLSAALEKAPEDPAVLKRAGLIAMDRGEDGKALTLLASSVTTAQDSMSREDLETTAFAAEIEARNGCYDEAIRLYDLLIDQGYYPMEHQYLAGLAFLSLHQTDAAEQYFSLAAAHEEAPAVWFIRIFRGFREEGESARAERWFEAGLGHLSAGNGMSEAAYYAEAGKMTEAMDLFSAETSWQGQMAYAACLMDYGLYGDAETVLVRLLAGGERPEAVCYRYLILKTLTGETADAERLLTEVRAYADPALSFSVDWNEIILYENAGNYKKAFSLISDFMKEYSAGEAVLREYAFLSRVSLSGQSQ